MQGAGLAHHGDNLQDILRILTLWFNYGALPDVEQALQDGFNRVTVDTWLVVIPQARRKAPLRAPASTCTFAQGRSVRRFLCAALSSRAMQELAGYVSG